MVTATKETREKVMEVDDDKLYTVLFGYGRVPPTAKTYLDNYLVEGGVIRNVPGLTARHWSKGTRPDGSRSQGRVTITILPQDATEEDCLAAVGISSDQLRRLAPDLNGKDISRIIEELGPDAARRLFDALNSLYSNKR